MLLFMGYELIFSEHSYQVYESEKAQLEQLQQEIDDLKAQRERLAKQILRLRNDPKALEELVHRELGYVYPDEYMLIVPEQPKKEGGRVNE